MTHTRALQFSTGGFDHRSNLPNEDNACTRFYWRSGAEFLAQRRDRS